MRIIDEAVDPRVLNFAVLHSPKITHKFMLTITPASPCQSVTSAVVYVGADRYQAVW
jgi:hypothetical protein